MALYAKGDKVINSKTELKGVVIEVKPAIRGKQLYLVSFSNGSQESILETVLRRDCDISNPFERCKLGMTATYSNFLKQNTTFKIKNSTNNTISSLKASRTMFKPYQFKPLLKFLNSNQRRLLVADEVGLGKTIEAGHIMLELKARGELTDVLIVCPKSLQEKWRTELLDKFALNFKVYEKSSELIQDMKNSIGYVKAIINYEKLQLKDDDPKRVNLANFFKNSGRNFSLVLCDESHRLRNPGTLTYKGATELLRIADAAVFLSDP
ncbi:MAG: DEAD/DEAH box helicase family protein [Fibrobacter sp.]|nr:DEAD/DEAH box helicase family protein [Fibrobacter sp.]